MLLVKHVGQVNSLALLMTAFVARIDLAALPGEGLRKRLRSITIQCGNARRGLRARLRLVKMRLRAGGACAAHGGVAREGFRGFQRGIGGFKEFPEPSWTRGRASRA